MSVSPVEDWTGNFQVGAHSFLIKRDDLTPFPFGGNKWRKLSLELPTVPTDATITSVGSVSSNHCRTLATLAAQRRQRVHLVLHAKSSGLGVVDRLALRYLEALGVPYELTTAEGIADVLDGVRTGLGSTAHHIPGGCHTARGVLAYRNATLELAEQLPGPPTHIYVPSGTGATQAGIILGTMALGWTSTHIRGISVARTRARGLSAVAECLSWFHTRAEIDFDDRFTRGGYGGTDSELDRLVSDSWARGLPMDSTYVGKALSAVAGQHFPTGSRVLLWHTGGAFQGLEFLARQEPHIGDDR